MIIKESNRKSGFTLAETLITLVIIGIIAMITMPAIYSAYEERERAAKVKKVYSTFAQAFMFARVFGADMSFEEVDKSQAAMNAWYNEFMKSRLNTVKVCYDSPGCWNEGDTFYWNGQKVDSNRSGIGVGNEIIVAILNDGTLVNMDMWSNQDSIKNTFGIDPKGSAMMIVFFDINGVKGPNTVGRDVFVMGYSAKLGLVPAYKDKTKSQINADCSKGKTGVSCIGKYLAN